MTHIASLSAAEILDSRGNPTLEVTLITSGGHVVKAAVPSGASTGSHEALELRDHDKKRYGGKGVLKAVAHVNGPIAKALMKQPLSDLFALDAILLSLDKTENKRELGANAILGASFAVAKGIAAAKNEPLYHFLSQGKGHLLPCPLINVINGGVHADNLLDTQEFMLVPHGAPTFGEAIRYGAETFHALKAILKKKHLSTNVGDEGGFAPPLTGDEEAIELLLEAIALAGFHPGRDISLALDAAATEFYADGYYIERKKKEAALPYEKRSRGEQVDYLLSLQKKYPIVSIEDGLAEGDWEGWKEMTRKGGALCQLVGDDLFVTNTRFLQRGIDEKAANAILIKPNQIGTLTETIAAIDLAKRNGYKTILSHRSGETEDTTIADLAVAFSSGQIKTGSVTRSERVAKYNRLLAIERELSKEAKYKNPFS